MVAPDWQSLQQRGCKRNWTGELLDRRQETKVEESHKHKEANEGFHMAPKIMAISPCSLFSMIPIMLIKLCFLRSF